VWSGGPPPPGTPVPAAAEIPAPGATAVDAMALRSLHVIRQSVTPDVIFHKCLLVLIFTQKVDANTESKYF
jgi:hypothetical protein